MAAGERPERQPWRDDIAGLRIVAIAGVVLSHTVLDRVSGGLDVFLLLAGFLLGGSLIRSVSGDRPAPLWRRMARRVWRLVPASAVVLATTAVLVVATRPQTRWLDGAQQTLASLGFYENWFLIANGRAYDTSAAGNDAWQHYWSLAVMGQLFVAMPVVVWAIHRLLARQSAGARRIAFEALTIVALVGSFVAANLAVGAGDSGAFYSTFTRMWEFLLGAALAILLAYWTPRGRVWSWLGVLGLGLLLGTPWLVSGGSAFPGWQALVPVGGAALVVLAGAVVPVGSPSAPHTAVASPGPVTRLLSWAPMSHAGKYSYALYLWHWPLLVFAIELSGGAPSLWLQCAVVGTAVVLAVATYHLVERPTFGSAWAGRRWARAAVLALVAALVVGGVAVIASARAAAEDAGEAVEDVIVEAQTSPSEEADAGDGSAPEPTVVDYPGALAVTDADRFAASAGVEPIPALEVVEDDYPRNYPGSCRTGLEDSAIVTCELGDPDGDVSVVMVGASHLVQWAPALVPYAETHGWRVTFIVKPGCPLLDHPDAERGSSCDPWRENVLDFLAGAQPDIVVTQYSVSLLPGSVTGAAEGVDLAQVQALAGAVPDATVIGTRDNRRFEQSMPECFASGGPCAFPVTGAGALASVDPAVEVAGVFGPGQFIGLDLNDVICPDGVCSPVQGNVFAFRDDDHLAATYVETLIPEVERRLDEALG